MNSLTLADRIDVSNTEQLAALYHKLAISREALQAVAEALRPAIQDVRFYVMR